MSIVMRRENFKRILLTVVSLAIGLPFLRADDRNCEPAPPESPSEKARPLDDPKFFPVADGVSRLRKWSGEQKPVWNCIECTRISNPNARATPHQVRAEVWMSLVRGSRGLIYFVHQFKPQFVEAGLLADAEMLAQVRTINRQIHELAPVLNGPSVADGVIVESSDAAVPVEAVVKRHEGVLYVFAVGMRDGATEAKFKLPNLPPKVMAEVLGENRTIEVRDGSFRDSFQPWDVHLYRVRRD